uniref:Single-stranded DNA binding protein n=1 Tax=Gracilaria firma TaxID=2510791 RepID=A0A1P8D6H7_9FLOR|nr:hypothetical protein [Gracilaria firma]APR74407.1 hypothetical protein [Gracilaria firma]
MNIVVLTVYLLTQPKLIKRKHQNFCYMLISLDNISNINIKAFAIGKIAKYIFDSYQQDSRVIIEASIYIKKNRLLKKNTKKMKIVFVKIHKVYNIDK